MVLNMQIETDGKDLILTPETNEDYFDLGSFTVRNVPYKLDMNSKKIKAMRINKENLLKILLGRTI